MPSNRVSSAAACAIASARAADAVTMWIDKLSEEERGAVRKRLAERQEWAALETWDARVTQWCFGKLP